MPLLPPAKPISVWINSREFCDAMMSSSWPRYFSANFWLASSMRATAFWVTSSGVPVGKTTLPMITSASSLGKMTNGVMPLPMSPKHMKMPDAAEA